MTSLTSQPWGIIESSFFSPKPCQQVGVLTGLHLLLKEAIPETNPLTPTQWVCPQSIGQIGEILATLPTPHVSLQELGLNMTSFLNMCIRQWQAGQPCS